jgi:chaperonin GroEL
MKKVGNEGVITVEEAKSLETELEVVEGMQFDRSYISPYFITNADKMRTEMEDPYLLIYEKKLSALNELLPLLESLKRVKTENEDQKHGVEIVKKAITWPARQIAINAGEDGSVIVGKILEKDQYAFGFDAQDGEYADLVKKGIIDPTKVVRIALQDGASIAGLLITTEAMVAEKPKKETPMPAMPPGGGMDY